MINKTKTYAERQIWPEKFTDVIYAAPHLRDGNGDGKTWEWDRGMVSSCNGRFIFVKFYSALSSNGWDGVTAQGCKPEDVIPG